MTPTLGYLLALLAITFVIDFTLRALPFKILEPLRDSRFVSDMAVWMPPGILLILVLSTPTPGPQESGGRWWPALVAAGVFYYVFNYVVAFAMEKWEQALRYYR